MTLADFAIAVTLGSIIGMAAILWDFYKTNKKLSRQNAHYRHEFKWAEGYCERLRTEISDLREKLSRFDRTRNSKGRSTKKGGA